MAWPRLTAPSPGRGPRGQGPSKIRQGPGKNNWIDHVPSGLPDKNFGICWAFLVLKKVEIRPNGNYIFHGGWSRRLSHTHSYPACHAPEMHYMKVSFWEASMLGHGAVYIGYTGPGPRMGPIDDFSLVTGPVLPIPRFSTRVRPGGSSTSAFVINVDARCPSDTPFHCR